MTFEMKYFANRNGSFMHMKIVSTFCPAKHEWNAKIRVYGCSTCSLCCAFSIRCVIRSAEVFRQHIVRMMKTLKKPIIYEVEKVIIQFQTVASFLMGCDSLEVTEAIACSSHFECDVSFSSFLKTKNYTN